MKIKKIHLENFKCFINKEIEFVKDFTVLVGNNATGKTAVLDALAIALGGFLNGFYGVKAYNNVRSRNILEQEVRLEPIPMGSVTYQQPQYPVKITCDAVMINKLSSWTRSLDKEDGRTKRREAKSILSYATSLQKKINQGDESVILPIVSYYGTGRLWAQKRDSSEKSRSILNSQFFGYTDCLDPASNEKLMRKWFEKMTYIQLQKGVEPHELKAVRGVLKFFLRNIDKDRWTEDEVDMYFNVDTEELEVKLGEAQTLPFKMLSDGYRNTLGMIADIAYRMAVLNPQLLDNVIIDTPGVVLIDELDLHLHPKWQRSIVSDLKSAFPKVQFIITTHSPFIIQSLNIGELRVLDMECVGEYVDLSIEDIIENIMGIDIPQWSERRKKMYEVAEKYYVLLNKMDNAASEELEKLKTELDNLSKPFADNLAYYAFLEQKRLQKEIEREGR